MPVHSRMHIVAKAGTEISLAITEICQKYKITFAEEIKIISGHLETSAKWEIRNERHPNSPNTPGDRE